MSGSSPTGPTSRAHPGAPAQEGNRYRARRVDPALDAVLLIVAKAPVAGLAKTRLASSVGARRAALLAAAALLDTVDSARAVPDATVACALTGALASAELADELASALRDCVVFPQHGATFADRLANAHAEIAARFPGAPVLQVGMDTPQLLPPLLTGALARLRETDAVLGPAVDGGWWALGLRRPADAHVLRAVPMSRPDTGARTLAALRNAGLRVEHLPLLSDVDTIADAVQVAAQAPTTRFAQAFAAVAS
ncbi:TIGR04282 family arsenosugar biosynthesis glycosyltransferase [Actinophytocola sp.]|uniref:TIGR04282 family arsenosugar biosynthesis glycosyltransferase n=1 Tax=Actinophytocola sp. TaxID=1872138 RepID=UPI002ED198DF